MRLLAAELDGARRLLAVLQREQQVLTGRDSEAVEQCAQDKHQALGALQQLALARRRFTATLAAGTLPDECAPTWRALEQALAELRRLNEVNGALVQRRLQHTRRALAILRGQSGDNEVYGPRGAFDAAPVTGRPIVSA
jgi:flagellar biosynthesis/type III secretory pathway chaperone